MTKEVNLLAYSCDASGLSGKASSVVFPSSSEEIRKIILSGKVTIRGAGTGLAGGCVPQNEIVLDLSKMNKIISFDEEHKEVLVESGIILDELNDFLLRYNLEFPVKPSSHSVCTIGGMIATNAAGERAIKYGKTGKWVEALEIVDGNGEIIKLNKYNLNDFIGLEGITGVIVRAKLKLIDKKERTANLLGFDSINEIAENVTQYSSLAEVSEIEFLDKTTSGLIGLGEKYHLIIEFENQSGDLRGEKYNELMKKREGLYPLLARAGFVHIEDPKINLNRLAELSSMLEDLKIPYYGHLGLGIVHPVFKEDEKNKIRQVLSFVKKLKGQVSGEHGIGLSKKEFLEDNEKKIISILKKRYDPHNRLNQGKVIDVEPIVRSSAEKRRLEELEKIEQAIQQQNLESEGEQE